MTKSAIKAKCEKERKSRIVEAISKMACLLPEEYVFNKSQLNILYAAYKYLKELQYKANLSAEGAQDMKDREIKKLKMQVTELQQRCKHFAELLEKCGALKLKSEVGTATVCHDKNTASRNCLLPNASEVPTMISPSLINISVSQHQILPVVQQSSIINSTAPVLLVCHNPMSLLLASSCVTTSRQVQKTPVTITKPIPLAPKALDVELATDSKVAPVKKDVTSSEVQTDDMQVHNSSVSLLTQQTESQKANPTSERTVSDIGVQACFSSQLSSSDELLLPKVSQPSTATELKNTGATLSRISEVVETIARGCGDPLSSTSDSVNPNDASPAFHLSSHSVKNTTDLSISSVGEHIQSKPTEHMFMANQIQSSFVAGCSRTSDVNRSLLSTATDCTSASTSGLFTSSLPQFTTSFFPSRKGSQPSTGNAEPSVVSRHGGSTGNVQHFRLDNSRPVTFDDGGIESCNTLNNNSSMTSTSVQQPQQQSSRKLDFSVDFLRSNNTITASASKSCGSGSVDVLQQQNNTAVATTVMQPTNLVTTSFINHHDHNQHRSSSDQPTTSLSISTHDNMWKQQQTDVLGYATTHLASVAVDTSASRNTRATGNNSNSNRPSWSISQILPSCDTSAPGGCPQQNTPDFHSNFYPQNLRSCSIPTTTQAQSSEVNLSNSIFDYIDNTGSMTVSNKHSAGKSSNDLCFEHLPRYYSNNNSNNNASSVNVNNGSAKAQAQPGTLATFSWPPPPGPIADLTTTNYPPDNISNNGTSVTLLNNNLTYGGFYHQQMDFNSSLSNKKPPEAASGSGLTSGSGCKRPKLQHQNAVAKAADSSQQLLASYPVNNNLVGPTPTLKTPVDASSNRSQRQNSLKPQTNFQISYMLSEGFEPAASERHQRKPPPARNNNNAGGITEQHQHEVSVVGFVPSQTAFPQQPTGAYVNTSSTTHEAFVSSYGGPHHMFSSPAAPSNGAPQDAYWSSTTYNYFPYLTPFAYPSSSCSQSDVL